MTGRLLAVKFADRERGIIEGLGAPFGEDLEGESFGPSTDFGLGLYERRPLLFHHGLDASAIRTDAIGAQTHAELVEEGLWIRAMLDMRSRWYTRVKKLIDAGALGFSTGAMPHLVKTTKRGQILAWPFNEVSLTPAPAHPGARIYSVKGDVRSLFVADRDDDRATTYTVDDLAAIGIRLPAGAPVSRAELRALDNELLASELRRSGVLT